MRNIQQAYQQFAYRRIKRMIVLSFISLGFAIASVPLALLGWMMHSATLIIASYLVATISLTYSAILFVQRRRLEREEIRVLKEAEEQAL